MNTAAVHVIMNSKSLWGWKNLRLLALCAIMKWSVKYLLGPSALKAMDGMRMHMPANQIKRPYPKERSELTLPMCGLYIAYNAGFAACA